MVTMQTTSHNGPATGSGAASGLLTDGPAGELSLVGIAQRLEQVTSAIETERTREREARQVYKLVADEVEQNIAKIRERAKSLIDEQRRRMTSFDGMLGRAGGNGQDRGTLQEVKPTRSGRMSLADAILRVWENGRCESPLTTEEISAALAEVGYTTKASVRSLKSTMNQALARLCRDRKLRRFRIDGDEIPPTDSRSRARRYMAAGI